MKVTIQVFCIIAAFICLGQAIDIKKARFENIVGFIMCLTFLLLGLAIQGGI
jgi:hypothetical protein